MFEFLSGIISALLTGYFFLLLDGLKTQRELTSVLITLAKECEYNSIHRGNSQCPFQSIWMERALTMQSFYEQMPATVEKCIEIFELAKDANVGNIDSRGIVPSTLQQFYIKIASEIQSQLPELRKRSTFWNYFIYSLRNDVPKTMVTGQSLEPKL